MSDKEKWVKKWIVLTGYEGARVVKVDARCVFGQWVVALIPQPRRTIRHTLPEEAIFHSKEEADAKLQELRDAGKV